MKRIRWCLSLPMLALRMFVAYTAGLGVGLLIKILKRISDGAYHHVAWPLLIAQRWVRGEPTWKYDDLAIGRLQPITKAQRAAAEADERIQRVECICGKRTCAARHGLYQPALPIPGFRFPSKEEVAKFVREQDIERAIDDMQGRINTIVREIVDQSPTLNQRIAEEVKRAAGDLAGKGFTAEEVAPVFKARGYETPRSN